MLPKNKATYALYIYDYYPLKDEPYKVRITVGDDKLDYNDNSSSPIANLLETKIIINSIISDAHRGARFICTNIKNHFLVTLIKNLEYIRVKYKYILLDIRSRYNLDDKVAPNGYICIKIQKDMLSLKQVAILAYQHLKNCLHPFKYEPIEEMVRL